MWVNPAYELLTMRSRLTRTQDVSHDLISHLLALWVIRKLFSSPSWRISQFHYYYLEEQRTWMQFEWGHRGPTFTEVFNLSVLRLCYKSLNDWTVQLIGLHHYFRQFIFALIHHLFKMTGFVLTVSLINYGNIKQLSSFIRKIYLLPLNLCNRWSERVFCIATEKNVLIKYRFLSNWKSLYIDYTK